jgi:hypothetical protein
MPTASDADALARSIQRISTVDLDRLRVSGATATEHLAIHAGAHFAPRAFAAGSTGPFDAIVADVVALANTGGGDVLIGGVTDHDGRIVDWRPVARCAWAAAQLRQLLADSIDPQVPRLVVRAVEFDASGAGVILCRVPRSRIAPHRAAPGDVCYARAGARTRALSIKEVQALAFATARSTARIDARLAELRDRYMVHARPIPTGAREYRDSVLVAAVPVDLPREIDRRWLWRREHPFPVPPTLVPVLGQTPWRRWPALGGLTWRHRTEQRSLRVEAFTDGALTAWLVQPADATVSGRRRLAELHLALTEALLGVADDVRAAVSSPRCEYAVDVHAQFAHARIELHPGERVLPVYSSRGLEPADRVLELLREDLNNLNLESLIPTD